VNHKQRHKRIRLLVKKLNKERKIQAKKMDMLCNDLIASQRDFIKKLNTISFTANFYEAIAGTADLGSLLHTTAKFIKDEIPDANITFFLRQQDTFESHLFQNDHSITLENLHLENCFTPELVNNICKSNKICTLDDMFAMGLQGNLSALNKISALTVPLGQRGSSLGFILIYHPSENKLIAEELGNISAITRGLFSAIQSCQMFSHSAD
jgi:hypothetical protein